MVEVTGHEMGAPEAGRPGNVAAGYDGGVDDGRGMNLDQATSASANVAEEEKSSNRLNFESYVEDRMKKFEELINNLRSPSTSGIKPNVISLDELRAQYQTVRENYVQLKEAGSDAWDEIKTGFQVAWDDLSDSLRSAVDRFMNLGNDITVRSARSNQHENPGVH